MLKKSALQYLLRKDNMDDARNHVASAKYGRKACESSIATPNEGECRPARARTHAHRPECRRMRANVGVHEHGRMPTAPHARWVNECDMVITEAHCVQL